MHQIQEKMDLIDLDEDTINVEVLDSLGVTMDQCRCQAIQICCQCGETLWEMVAKLVFLKWQDE